MKIVTQQVLFEAVSLACLAALLNAINNGEATFEDERPALWPLPTFGGADPSWIDHSRAMIFSWDRTHFLVDSRKTNGVRSDPQQRFLLVPRSHFASYGAPRPVGGDAAESAPAVFGIISGNWSQEIADRVPSGTAVYLRQHADAAGDKYTAQILKFGNSC